MKKGNKNLQVVILTCTQSAQRINYYNVLGQMCKLTVIAERETPEKILHNYDAKPYSYQSIYLKGLPMFGYMAFCPSIIKILENRNFDIIIVEQYATPTAFLAINYLNRHSIPFVISADGGFPNEEENFLKYHFKKSLISKASFWITGGKESIGYLEHYGADPTRTKVFKFSPYSKKDQIEQETTSEKKQEVRNKLNMQEQKVIVSVGQQIHRKGFDVLLRAMQKMKLSDNEVGLYILGGQPNEECQVILNEMSMTNVHFPGLVTKDQLKLYYAAADLFVFPTRYDIWGYPINEAMSFGLPIITTYQCNAGLELIEDGVNGYLVEAEDVAALSSAIITLLKDDELRIEMGKRNYIKSKDYTSETMAESIYEIIRNFAQEAGK